MDSCGSVWVTEKVTGTAFFVLCQIGNFDFALCRGRIYQSRNITGSMIRMVNLGIVCEAGAINGAPAAVAASSILLFVWGGFISPAYISAA